MTLVSRTRAQLRQELIRRLLPDTEYVLTTPSAIAASSVTYGHLAGLRPDGHFQGGEVWTAVSGVNESRRISAYAQSTGVITPVTNFSGSPTAAGTETLRAGVTFDQLNEALSQAEREAASYFLVDAVDVDMAGQRGLLYEAPSSWAWLTGVERDHSAVGGDRFCVHSDTFTAQPLDSLSTNQQIAQMIEVGTPMAVAAVWVFGRFVGTASGTLTASIQTTSNSLPSGTNVTNGAGTARNASEADTDYRWFRLALAVPAWLDDDTTYAIALTNSVGTDANSYFEWGYDTQSSYSYGERATYNGSAWSAASGAHLFRLEPVEPEYRALDMRQVRVQMGASRPIVIASPSWYPSGTLLRFSGMRTPTAMSADSSTSEIEPSTVVDYALGLLLEQRAAADLATLQKANYFKTQARDQWKRTRTIVKGRYGVKQLRR